MAFLSSFRVGAETVYPDELRERLRGFALFENVGESALRALMSEANWFALPGGTLLDRDGENDAALFLVVAGSLGVFVKDAQGQRRLITHVPAGETVGEMSLIAGSSGHSAQIVALRDTELLRISPAGFEALIARHPRVMMNITRFLVRRLQVATRQGDGARPRTFAIVPLQPGLADAPIAFRLATALTEMGSRAAVLDSAAAEQDAEWFNSFEQAHDVVYAACRVVNERGGTLAAVLAADPEVTKHLDKSAITRMTDPANYSGLAPQMVDRDIASVKR